MAIPWLPREISSRLHEKPHEAENVKATYLLSTANVAGFLAREDGKRPSWFDRSRIVPVSTLTPDLQAHLSNACRVICMKARLSVSTDPVVRAGPADPTRGERPQTQWQAGLMCARVLWRALFAAAANKANVKPQAVPVLYMIACNSLKQASKMLLYKVWHEVQEQFTSRCSKYRNMKSRPAWPTLEAHQYQVFGETFGFGIMDPSTTAPASAGTKPAANLQDFLEEVLALRFTVDWLSAAEQDAQEFLDHSTRRLLKRSAPKTKVAPDFMSQQLAALKEKSVDSFSMMWTDDAELRGVAALAIRLMDSLEGPSAMQFAATFTGQMLLAMWKGVEPLLAHHAAMGIARIADSHAAIGKLPPPPLQDLDADVSQTAVFDRIEQSYDKPSKNCEDLVAALPRGVRGSIVKVQSVFRGFVFRARYFPRSRATAAYCKAVGWPTLHPSYERDIAEDDKDKKRRKKANRVDANTLNEQIADFQPNVSKYLGGEQQTLKAQLRGAVSPSAGRSTMSASGGMRGNNATMQSTASAGFGDNRERAWPLPTADHRACADLFSLYIYNLYRRKELTHMWQTLCGAYERGMDAYAELLNRNPALKPMLESIAAQLKRGSVVGFDKAFIAKQRKEEPPLQGRIKPADAELFKRKTNKFGQTLDSAGTLDETLPGMGDSRAFPAPKASLGAAGTMNLSMAINKRGMTEEKKDQGVEVTGEYLTQYLKEMDGDDSQFKDIVPSVIPFSTGSSPPRVAPQESIIKGDQGAKGRPESQGPGIPSLDSLRAKQASTLGVTEDELRGPDGRSATGRMTPQKPKLDVPFCLQRVKPIWLPIKAHRFAAYRAKVLQLLPQKVLQQYVDFEKQGQYAACIKLLESATPGSINILAPATLVNNKPLLVETVLQLIVGYSGLCLKNNQGTVAVKLITQVLDSMSLAFRDLHPGHRTVLEAYLFDTALSVCYYMPTDLSLSDRAESFFQQASERYLRLGHVNRYCKCCLRAAAVLHQQGSRGEAEYYTQQALGKLSDAPVSSLLAVCYHNLAVHTIVQNRVADAVANVRSYVALLRQLPKLGNSWMQLMDNTQWLILKAQELWPQYQQEAGMRDSQLLDGMAPAWTVK